MARPFIKKNHKQSPDRADKPKPVSTQIDRGPYTAHAGLSYEIRCLLNEERSGYKMVA